MREILYICHNQRNLHNDYGKVQETTYSSHERAAFIFGENSSERDIRGDGDPEGERAASSRRVRRQEAAEGCGDSGHAEHNPSGGTRHKAELSGTVGRGGSRERHQAEEAGDTACPGEMYRRHRGQNHSPRLRRPSGRLQPLDPASDIREGCRDANHRRHITHAGGTHSKKNEYKPHLRKMWCIPPRQNAAFVAAMEDVLEVYSRPYDPKQPVVCMDEQPIELHQDARETITLSETNHTEKVDHEYVRNGTCCGFMFTEPLGGWRRVTIKRQRRKQDWAEQIKELVDVDYPDADKIVLVCDNLNTHNISSLYETFEPAEARRIWERLELHHTPKHGSWLDIAEIELSAFTKGCLGRRIATMEELQRESTAWYVDRNKRQKGVDWQFSVGDARTRLRHLYPIIKIHV